MYNPLPSQASVSGGNDILVDTITKFFNAGIGNWLCVLCIIHEV